ncbi:MAG: hypothetical protein SFU98_09580 [Leptospiraceae bacterium]|nr:hypothetical protein [Leptospiraceae bacterium]
MIRCNDLFPLSFPSRFDFNETYLNVYTLQTIQKEQYLLIEIDYADFRMPEIVDYVKIEKEDSFI